MKYQKIRKYLVAATFGLTLVLLPSFTGGSAALAQGGRYRNRDYQNYDRYYDERDHQRWERNNQQRHERREREALKNHQRSERYRYGNSAALRHHQQHERENLKDHNRDEKHDLKHHQRDERNDSYDGYSRSRRRY